ncbi:MAG: hypothetical protein JRG80_23195 [Deltaproteobacteria bacterium]|nr:hypothetical protein [Deltaproteobacteria bacterium]
MFEAQGEFFPADDLAIERELECVAIRAKGNRGSGEIAAGARAAFELG